jgi:hypothetical protein
MVYSVYVILLLLLLVLLAFFLVRTMRRQPQLLARFSPGLPILSYGQRRMVVSVSMLVLFLFGFSLQSGLAAGTLQQVSSNLEQVVMRSEAAPTILLLAPHTDAQMQQVQSEDHVEDASPGAVGLVRVDSAARNQYATLYQWEVWAYSSCSGIAMETVMNFYGRHLIASDVLQVEQNLSVWNVQLGLLRDDGIAETAAYFGFDTRASHTLTVDQVVAIANQGKPVIVSVRDNWDFPGGHIFVVSGGDAQSVYVVDSSLFNLHSLSRAQFSAMWQGFSAVLTPR